MFEINEGVFGPQSAAQLVARDHFIWPLQQYHQNFERLALKFQTPAIPAQFSIIEIEFKSLEPNAMV